MLFAFSMQEVFFRNFTTQGFDENFFKKIFAEVLAAEKVAGAIIEVAIVGEKRMKDINNTYRGINKVTDVLSFEENKIQNPLKKRGFVFIEAQKSKERMLGQIVLCPMYIKKQATQYGKTFKEELAHVYIHGILHLLEYNHILDKDAKIMESKEAALLKKLGY